jgi:anaerobic selenocysteine-containing dehydrogenase
MTKKNGSSALTRRDFLKASVFLGSTTLLVTQVPQVIGRMRSWDRGGHTVGDAYKELTKAENILYTACLGCHTSCGAKARILDGVLAKLDGNPYSAHNMLPQPPYETPPWELTRIDGKFCPKGQTMIQTVYDPYRIRTALKRTGKRGEGKWITIPFQQAIDEMVNGGYLSRMSGEGNDVGLRICGNCAIPNAKNITADVKAIVKKRMTVPSQGEVQDNLDLLID